MSSYMLTYTYISSDSDLPPLAPSNDKIPFEDQPLPADASIIGLSPGYVADSNTEEDPEEDLVDYLDDGGDDREEEKEESSKDDDDGEEDEEASEEDELLALANSTALPAIDLV
nr:hypothetical protein [Tanacetum cinerariifolium]